MTKFRFVLIFTISLLAVLTQACALSANVDAVQKETEQDFAYEISGWNEIVVSVSEFDSYHKFFVDIAGWELREQGDVSREALKAWAISDKASAEFRVYGNINSQSGYIRLLKFKGVKQGYMRIDQQSWDTGGIFDFNVRVKDLDKAADKMRKLGWQARSPVTSFTFGPFKVKEWIVNSPDGMSLAMIERLEPELEGWSNLKKVSRTFNSTQVVKDIDASLRFYEDVLGFKRYLEHKGASDAEKPNVLGLPHNMTTKVPREVYILSHDGKNEGSVEILGFDGATGRDFSASSHLPNLGIAALRFPVKGIEALEKHFKSKGVTWVVPLTVLNNAQTMTIEAPEGGWLEFYEVD